MNHETDSDNRTSFPGVYIGNHIHFPNRKSDRFQEKLENTAKSIFQFT